MSGPINLGRGSYGGDGSPLRGEPSEGGFVTRKRLILLGFNHHSAAHLKVQCVAEPGAVEPVQPGLACGEGHALRVPCVADEVHIVLRDTEAMAEVLNAVEVGQDDLNLVTGLDLEVLHPVGGGLAGHVDPDLVALADDLVVLLEVDFVFFGPLVEHVVAGAVPRADLHRMDGCNIR